jgi:diaminohydroxyphosphoribosylaminopyrimidine deaminase/5-amino-6-(5-phosphoribosylamino)uracil reductase
VKKVVVANIDTNPVVNEAGIHRLRAAGIVVITGILEKECRQLNRRFFTFVEKKRPHIILKWAETADGFIARKNFSSKWISDEFSRQMVHKMRAETDAVLVGRNTAQFDNPELSVRDWSGRNPVRVIIDRFLKLSESLKIFDGTQPTLVYNVLKHEERQGTSLIRIDEDDFILKLVSDLYKRNIQSLMVEGGAQTLQAFISAGLWDEAFVFVSPQNFGEGIASPKISGLVTSQGKIKNDWVKIIHNNAAAMHTIS